MNMRRSGSIAGNPILIGALTVLISVVGVFLAYNANEGLPFVPKYTLTAQVPNAVALVKGNEVKIGGARVGMVTAIRPRTWPNGATTALIDMQLDKKIQPVPLDSTIEIRPASPLGLKYVDLHRGTSAEGFSTGATMPLRAATPEPVQIDEIFNMFDKPTRDASSANLIEFGNALAGRGLALNESIQNLQPLLVNLEPVMKNLNSDKTNLQALFPALEQAAAAAAPVAEEQAGMFRGLDQTFTALAGVTSSIQAAISNGPAALDAAINAFPSQQALLNDSATLFATLTPGAVALGESAPTLAAAAKAAADPNGGVARSPVLNARLARLLTGLQTFLSSTDTKAGVARLIKTTDAANPLVSYVGPTQTTCNYVSLLLRNASSMFSSGFTTGGGSGGTFLRALAVINGWGPLGTPAHPTDAWDLNAQQGSASGPAAGPTAVQSFGSNVLHSNAFPYTDAPGQPKSCQAGNEAFKYPNESTPIITSGAALDPARGTQTEQTTPPPTPPGK